MAACPMDCHCIPALDTPRVSALHAAYISNFKAVAGYFSLPPTLESIRQSARETAIEPALRRQVVEVLRVQNQLFGSDATVASNLDRLAAGAAAIVSGQQVGLFSGPSYTIYKALPILGWRTKDRVWGEVNHCFWPSRTGPQVFELPPDPSAAGHKVGDVRLGA